MRLFELSLQYSLENARIDSDLVLWIEEDYCSLPLTMDRYFDNGANSIAFLYTIPLNSCCLFVCLLLTIMCAHDSTNLISAS